MQWSKLKSRIKSLIDPELRDRIDFHLTSYRKSHDGADKVWVSVDGRRVFDCKHYREARWIAAAYFTGIRGIKSALTEVGIHGPEDFGRAMRCYLDLPINEALKSPDPIVRAFAIVDRRIGKRTLATLDLSDCDHPLVNAFYDLRCSFCFSVVLGREPRKKADEASEFRICDFGILRGRDPRGCDECSRA